MMHIGIVSRTNSKWMVHEDAVGIVARQNEGYLRDSEFTDLQPRNQTDVGVGQKAYQWIRTASTDRWSRFEANAPLLHNLNRYRTRIARLEHSLVHIPNITE